MARSMRVDHLHQGKNSFPTVTAEMVYPSLLGDGSVLTAYRTLRTLTMVRLKVRPRVGECARCVYII